MAPEQIWSGLPALPIPVVLYALAYGIRQSWLTNCRLRL